MQYLIEQAGKHLQSTAIISSGHHYSYTDLLRQSESIALFLLQGEKDLNEARVAFMVDPDLTTSRFNGEYGAPVELLFPFVCLIRFHP